MDTDVDRLLRDSAPSVLLPDDLARAMEETARTITRRPRPASALRRGVLIAAGTAAAAIVGATLVSNAGASRVPQGASVDSYSAKLALVAAQAPTDLSLPAGVTRENAAVAVLHKITVNPDYTGEAGLRTVADIYYRYAECQALVFKPAIGTTVNGIEVTKENPTPGGPATLIFPDRPKGRIPQDFVQTQCTDGLADAPKTTK